MMNKSVIMQKNTFGIVIAFISILMSSCKKFIAIDPPKKQLTSETVFESDVTAEATIIDLYAKFSNQSYFAAGGNVRSFSSNLCFLSDEAIYWGSATAAVAEFSTSNILPTNTYVSSIWGAQGYSFIYTTNATIEGL